MGMYISIGKNTGWGLTSGLFDIITESTRELFSAEQYGCMKSIYEAFDDQGQSFIVLDSVDRDCFNLFYRHCKAAMEAFPDSPRGKISPLKSISGILWNWSEILRLMREDSRYRG
ncbi:hypothetical protein [Budvicia diplopodorum]|uniref:hypothetical protein n=1 Tax=Budvicia diplopodorum TaxID=1119056 RepID=UPI00135BDFA7|nr:hypothetical protein [Budvicia diplopodorum]